MHTRARRRTAALIAAVTVAGTGLVAAGPAPAGRAAGAPNRCVSWTRGDPAGDASLDAVAYGLELDCATDQWHAWFTLASTLNPARVKSFRLLLDTDLDPATGCGGADWEVRISNAGPAGLVAQARNYPTTSCASYSDRTNAMQAYVNEVGSRGAGVSVLGGALTYDRSKGFRWWALLTDAATGAVDRLPDGSGRTTYVPTASDIFLDRSVAPVSQSYAGVIGGDFDGDGRGDVLLYAPGSAPDRVGYGSNAGAPFVWKPATVNGTYLIVAGDFNGDGRSDLLFYRTGAPSIIWYGRANRTFSTRAITIPAPLPRIVAGDFDNNQKTDLLLYRPGGPSVLWISNGTGFTAKPLRLTASLTGIASGDFDGDGRSDLLLYRAGGGADYVWRQYANGAFTASPITINGTYSRIVVGDFNADLRADVLLYGYGTAPDALLRGSGSAPSLTSGWNVSLNEPYSAITSGRYDSNATDDLFMYGTAGAPERWWVSQL